MDWPHKVTQSNVLFAPFHAESGRSDAVNTINDFVFTQDSRSAFENFTIVDDDVLEFDEIFIAEYNFGPEIANTWNVIKGEPSTALILIWDDDCELCRCWKDWCNTFDAYNYFKLVLLFSHHISCSVVTVTFNEDSYTVAESDGQLSLSLRINGQFFIPVWAVVEIIDGTATYWWVLQSMHRWQALCTSCCLWLIFVCARITQASF